MKWDLWRSIRDLHYFLNPSFPRTGRNSATSLYQLLGSKNNQTIAQSSRCLSSEGFSLEKLIGCEQQLDWIVTPNEQSDLAVETRGMLDALIVSIWEKIWLCINRLDQTATRTLEWASTITCSSCLSSKLPALYSDSIYSKVRLNFNGWRIAESYRRHHGTVRFNNCFSLSIGITLGR